MSAGARDALRGRREEGEPTEALAIAASSSRPGGSTLTRRTVRGVVWTLSTSLGSRAVGLIGTLVLARFIAPAEYGEVSAAFVVTATATGVTTFGVGIYLVSNRDLSRAEVFHATCWFIVTGVVALGAAAALSGPLGTWSDAPHLARFMPLLVTSAVLDRVAYVPERMLVRTLRFGWVSVARALGELAYTGVSLAVGASGAGAIAVAWGVLARSALRFVAIVPAVGWREWLEPHALRLATMLRIVGYGMTVTMTSVATFAMRRWDNLLVSRYFGPAVMGAYNYAYNLADTPAGAVGEQVSDVVGASFPHAAPEQRGAGAVRACTMMAVIMFPLAFGLAAVSDTIVRTFFAERWADVGPMLAILSVISATRPMALVLLQYFWAGGRPRVVLWIEWLSLAAMVLAIASIGRVGIRWACASVSVVFVLRTLCALWEAHRLDRIPLSRFLAPMLGPLLASVGIVAAIAAARPWLHGVAPGSRLVIEMGIGAAVYAAGALVLFGSTVRELVALLRSGLARR